MIERVDSLRARASCPTCKGSGEILARSPSGSANDPDNVYAHCPVCLGRGDIRILVEPAEDTDAAHELTVDDTIYGTFITRSGEWFASTWADHRQDNLWSAIEAALAGRNCPLHPDHALDRSQA